MKKESQCNVLCENTITKDQAKLFIERIKQHYSVHLLVVATYILSLLVEYLVYCSTVQNNNIRTVIQEKC